MKRMTAIIVVFIFAVGLTGCNPQTASSGGENTAFAPSEEITQPETTPDPQEENKSQGPAASEEKGPDEADDVMKDADTSPTTKPAAPKETETPPTGRPGDPKEMQTPPTEGPGDPKETETPPTEGPGEPEETEAPPMERPGEPEETEAPPTEGPGEPEAADTYPAAGPTGSRPVDTVPPTEPTEEESADTPSSMELKNVGSLQYYLYTPSDPERDMPLILYLHGGTNKREDVSALLTTDGFPQYLYEGYYGDLRAYVAIPKLDNRYKGWSDISDQIRDLIKSLGEKYFIDMNRISLTGHSMGGTGTYQLQVKLSNTFACIAPMSGSIQNREENVAALCKTKTWAFVGTEDTIVDPNSSRDMIEVLQERGANAKITELDGATHFDVPSLAYKDDALIQWLVNCGE